MSSDKDWSLYGDCYQCKALAGIGCDPDYDDGSWFGFLGNTICASRAYVNKDLAVEFCARNYCLSRYIDEAGKERWTDGEGNEGDDYNAICYESRRSRLKEYIRIARLGKSKFDGPRGTPEKAADGWFIKDKLGGYLAGYGEYCVYLRFGKTLEDRCLGAEGYGEFGYPSSAEELIRILQNPQEPMALRMSAAFNAAHIGGPVVMDALWAGYENQEYPEDLREVCLIEMANLWVGGWDSYCMSADRVTLTPENRVRIREQGKGVEWTQLNQTIANVLRSFN